MYHVSMLLFRSKFNHFISEARENQKHIISSKLASTLMKMKLCQTCISIFFFLLIGLLTSQSALDDKAFEKIRVHIVNGFQSETLQVHCKSKENDLGDRNIPVNQEFSWKFHINIWRSTLFFCDTRWSRGHKRFDAFAVRYALMDYCNGNCVWKANETAIFLLDNHNQTYIELHSWE